MDNASEIIQLQQLFSQTGQELPEDAALAMVEKGRTASVLERERLEALPGFLKDGKGIFGSPPVAETRKLQVVGLDGMGDQLLNKQQKTFVFDGDGDSQSTILYATDVEGLPGIATVGPGPFEIITP